MIGTELDMMEAHETSYLDLALEISHQLGKHYPNHKWIVSFQGGALIVRHALINAYAAEKLKREGFGFTLPKITTRREAVKGAIEAGGAMLELFGLKRGAWDGEEPQAPADWQPKQDAGFA
jgi:hypothetical protein